MSLEENISIEKVSNKKRRELLEKFLPPSEYYKTPMSLRQCTEAIATCEHAVVIKGESRHADTDFQLSTASLIESVLSSMRLFKEGCVNAECIFFYHETEPKYYPYYGGLYFGLPRGAPYILFESEVSNFIELWNKYKNIDISKGFIRVAIERFNRSFNRTLINEDKLIDYMIAFEALYLKKNIQDKGKEIASSASSSIGENRHQKEEIYSALRQAYRERNNIVHGKKIEDTVNINGIEVTLNDFIFLIEEYLRRSIKKHLDLPIKYVRNDWNLKNLRLRYLASKGKLVNLGYFNGDCPYCGSHIGTDVFETGEEKKYLWCGSCRKEIFKDINHQQIEWK